MCPSYSSDPRLLKRVDLALGLDIKGPDRVDLIPEQLDPDRVEGLGGEDVDDPAVDRELPGPFDRRGPLEPPLDQPAQELFGLQRVADPDRARAGCDRFLGGDRMQQGGDAGDNHLGRVRRLDLLEQPQPRSVHSIRNRAVFGERLPGRNTTGESGSKDSRSAAKSSTS